MFESHSALPRRCETLAPNLRSRQDDLFLNRLGIRAPQNWSASLQLKTHYFCIGLEFFSSARNKDAVKLVREPATAMQRFFDINQIVTLLRQRTPDLFWKNGPTRICDLQLVASEKFEAR
jgi:hypothetical protein